MMGKNNLTITDHHIIPSSRGGNSKRQNIKRVPDGFHNSFHTVFENLTPAEIYDYLAEVWFSPNGGFIPPSKWLESHS